MTYGLAFTGFTPAIYLIVGTALVAAGLIMKFIVKPVRKLSSRIHAKFNSYRQGR